MQAIPMHNCLNGHEFFLYLDGSASTPNKTRIEKHLNVCNRCFEAFISLFNDFLDGTPERDRGNSASAFEGRYA